MCDGTGLSNFKKQFPDRFFDVGIAEQHALGMAAGMAKDGLIPVVPIYSSFYQRGYDQVIHDICLQKLPVIMCVDRAGIVGNDGETHQGILDLAFFSLVPNLTILAPKDFKELEQMLEFAVELKAPVVIRYPRGGEERAFASHKEISLGESELLKDGNDLTIIGIGKTTKRALDVSDILEKKGISCEVINARFLKPFDNKNILNSFKNTIALGTVDDINSSASTGHIGICPVRLGAGVQNKILEYMALGLPCITSSIGYEGINAKSGSEIFVADTVEQYKNVLREIIYDYNRYTEVAENARSFVENNFSWESKVANLMNTLDEKLYEQ